MLYDLSFWKMRFRELASLPESYVSYLVEPVLIAIPRHR